MVYEYDLHLPYLILNKNVMETAKINSSTKYSNNFQVNLFLHGFSCSRIKDSSFGKIVVDRKYHPQWTPRLAEHTDPSSPQTRQKVNFHTIPPKRCHHPHLLWSILWYNSTVGLFLRSKILQHYSKLLNLNNINYISIVIFNPV